MRPIPPPKRLLRPVATILVLDGEERASLAVVRSLVSRGHVVFVTSKSRWSLGGGSSGVRRVRIETDPLTSPGPYAIEIAKTAVNVSADVLIPVTDASAEAVLEHRDLLPATCRVPFASLAVYRQASDKVLVQGLAQELGIGVPDSHVLPGASLPDLPDDELYPAVIKPHRSVVGFPTRTKTRVRFVSDRIDARRVLLSMSAAAFPVLLQRRVHGSGEGVFIARWNGRTIARFAHRRLREKPPSGGVSVFRESAAVDADVLRACEELLDRLGWQGVAMLEGKRDDATGRWCLMEINGRFWGSLQLAVDSGVDFPALLVEAVLGVDLPPPPNWRLGVRLRWEWGDIDHLLIRLRRSSEKLALPPKAPSRLQVIMDFISHRFGSDRLEVLRLRDPYPFVIETLQRIGVLLK